MRVTMKGVLLGGSVGVLITTALLWTQCRPPLGIRVAPGGEPVLQDGQQQQQQKRRQPLMTHHQANGGFMATDDYTEDGNAEPPRRHHIAGSNDFFSPVDEEDQFEDKGEESLPLSEIACVINQETTISCRRDEAEVYIPFSFIHNYFEVYGRITVNEQGHDMFEWSHSYSNVFEPQTAYKPIGKFLNFQLFNVEARERVKCISASEGVPISTQWQSSGYTYPIQIAQYGLSHYSKFLEEPTPKKWILEDGSKRKAKWKYESPSSISRSYNTDINSFVLKFKSHESLDERGISLKVPETTPLDLTVVNIYMQLDPTVNSSISFTLQTHDKKSDLFYLHYVCSNKLIETKDQHIFYGLGTKWNWRYLTRNLMVDLFKGVATSSHPKKLKKRINKSKVKIMAIEIRGGGEISNISLATSEHIRHFYDAADWLIRHQDERGGWPIPVARKVIAGLLEVEPGWYSAMAQGQAISLLVRAAHFSGHKKYIQSATRATKLFSVNVTNGGVRTYFPGGFVWFEEYPTSPSLFVLNGFMYSLLGLYDLKQSTSAPPNPSDSLYAEGMRSLKVLLPLFDTGQGSLYDLRHFTSHIAPNLARWDYHTTHITQLLTLATVESEEDNFLYATAQRWKEYMVGRRARHN